jgi:hypothetical protein
MATKIDSKTARDGLRPQREPYLHKIKTGSHLGSRKPATGEGT